MQKKSIEQQKGNTLLEILLVITIMTILCLGSLPNLNKCLIRIDQEIALERIKNAIEFAKNEALRRNKTMTLCPSHNQNSCTYGENWGVGFLLFENPKKDTQPAAGAILQIFSGSYYGKIIYTAIGNQLNIQADGSTTNIGSFVYCTKKDIIKPKGLVLNWATRVYPAEENAAKFIETTCIMT